VPFYRGERITFDVAPSRMNFKVEHNSLKLEVKLISLLFFICKLRNMKGNYSKVSQPHVGM